MGEETLNKASRGGDGFRVLATLAAGVIVIAGLQASRDIILPIILASFFAIVSYPVTVFLREKLRFPHSLSVFFTVVVDFGILTGLGFLINYLARDLSMMVQGKYVPLLLDHYQALGSTLKDWNLATEAEGIINQIKELANGPFIMDLTTMVMGKALTFLTVSTIVLILMTFFLAEAPRFRQNVGKLSMKPDSNVSKVATALGGVQKYLIIKTVISVITGVLAGILCKVMGVDLPILWGVVAFALNYVPTFGSIVAAIPPIILALLMGGATDSAIIALGYLGINCLLGQGIEPLLMGKQFGIATSVVLLSVVFWGWVLGPIGMLLAVPISVLVKLALESSKDLKWVAMLIDNPPKSISLPNIPLMKQTDKED